MNDNGPTTSSELTYALRLINQLPAALHHQATILDDLQQRLTELEGRTCTGNAHWRDKDTPGKTAKLYVLHGTDQACPVHGEPDPGKRNRTYIGNKPDRIAEALAAIERNTERLDLERRVARPQEAINRVVFRLKNMYYALDYAPPEPGEAIEPIRTDDVHVVTI